MFKDGSGVNEAYSSYRAQLMDQFAAGDFPFGDRGIEAILADSSLCPTERQVRYLFVKWNEQEFGAHNGIAMWDHIDRYVVSYNETYHKLGGRINFKDLSTAAPSLKLPFQLP